MIIFFLNLLFFCKASQIQASSYDSCQVSQEFAQVETPCSKWPSEKLIKYALEVGNFFIKASPIPQPNAPIKCSTVPFISVKNFPVIGSNTVKDSPFDPSEILTVEKFILTQFKDGFNCGVCSYFMPFDIPTGIKFHLEDFNDGDTTGCFSSLYGCMTLQFVAIKQFKKNASFILI